LHLHLHLLSSLRATPNAASNPSMKPANSCN
jgi:hypothetical protein